MITGIGNSTPWLILAGSGGVADILVTLLSKGSWDTDSVQELLSDTFPGAHHTSDLRNWIKLVRPPQLPPQELDQTGSNSDLRNWCKLVRDHYTSDLRN